MPEPIHVLIADDQALVRAGFRLLIENEPDMTVVGEAADGAVAVELAERTRPDVMLMDIHMPVMDGIEAIRRITSAEECRIRIVVLTTFDDDQYIFDALTAGASGFLLKNTDPAQLLHGIRVVAGGEELLSPGLTRRLLGRLADSGLLRPVHGAFDDLTAREREVVTLVALGLSNAEITRQLRISEATTKTHISRALSKLGARDRAQLVALAYQHRLVVPPESSK